MMNELIHVHLFLEMFYCKTKHFVKYPISKNLKKEIINVSMKTKRINPASHNMTDVTYYTGCYRHVEEFPGPRTTARIIPTQ